VASLRRRVHATYSQLRWTRSWVVLLSVLVVLSAGLDSCGAASNFDRAVSVSSNLLMVGSSRWVARGVVDYVLPFYVDAGDRPDPDLVRYTTADFTERKRIFEAMHADGVNLVRVPVGLSAVSGKPYGLSLNSYVRRLALVVKAARAAGLRVLICWWDSLSEGPNWPREYRGDFTMMSAVAHAFAGDPDVMYEPDNEPHGVTVAQWTDVMSATLREWRTKIGYKGVLVIDTPGYSWTFPPAAAAALEKLDGRLLGGRPELVFANHRYPNGAKCFCGAEAEAWQEAVGRWIWKFPILGGEYGSYTVGFPANRAWLGEIAAYLRRQVPKGLNGMIAFVWSWVDPNSLTHRNHLTLDSPGRAVRSKFWEVA